MGLTQVNRAPWHLMDSTDPEAFRQISGGSLRKTATSVVKTHRTPRSIRLISDLKNKKFKLEKNEENLNYWTSSSIKASKLNNTLANEAEKPFIEVDA